MTTVWLIWRPDTEFVSVLISSAGEDHLQGCPGTNVVDQMMEEMYATTTASKSASQSDDYMKFEGANCRRL